MLHVTARNMTEDERKGYREIKWDDREVCGPFMVRFCPHDLFVNTKSNLGTLFLFPGDLIYHYLILILRANFVGGH